MSGVIIIDRLHSLRTSNNKLALSTTGLLFPFGRCEDNRDRSGEFSQEIERERPVICVQNLPVLR